MPPDKADSSLFTWELWCAGSIHELGVQCRYYDITEGTGRELLRKHVVHWCDGPSLVCRPKRGHVAVMCFHEERHFWFHVTEREFDAVFPGVRG